MFWKCELLVLLKYSVTFIFFFTEGLPLFERETKFNNSNADNKSIGDNNNTDSLKIKGKLFHMLKQGETYVSRKELVEATPKDDGIYHDLPPNGELFEGDIIMDDRLRRTVLKEKTKKSALLLRGLFGRLDLTWTHGVMYYEIETTFPPSSRILLQEAMRQIERRTCVRFRKHTDERNYVVFTSAMDDLCFSSIGMVGRRQVINLGSQCTVIGTFEHEIMHALGILHEQSRPDRDDYIKVNYENIKRRALGNFHKYRFYEVDNLKQRFNFASIMLYSNKAFTKNGRDTIEALREPYLKFGQRIGFSIDDINEINILYRCYRKLKHPEYRGLVGNYYGGYLRGKRRHLRAGIGKYLLSILWRLAPYVLFFAFIVSMITIKVKMKNDGSCTGSN